MNTYFEILPFPAALLESGEVSDEEGVQEERFSRGMGRAARPSAPRGRPGGKSVARMAYGSGGAAARFAGKMGKMGKMGKAGRTGGFARPEQKWPQKWPHRRPHYWPHYWPGGWLGGYGFWPAGVAVYEPDWLAVADAPPGDAPGPDADGGRDDGMGGNRSISDGNGNSFDNGFGDGGFGDGGESGLGGFSSAG